jgi:hypothetical protein
MSDRAFRLVVPVSAHCGTRAGDYRDLVLFASCSWSRWRRGQVLELRCIRIILFASAVFGVRDGHVRLKWTIRCYRRIVRSVNYV